MSEATNTDNSKEQISISKEDEVSETFSPRAINASTETEEQPAAYNLEPTTEKMEVHHHPHVEKKNFKEYLLEGLMIFIAVTMGFFAETIREDFTEKAREKEYMQEITENLQYDTVRCGLNRQSNVEVLKGLDSLRSELKNAMHGNVNQNALYYFSHYTGNTGIAVFNTSAITELKSSGSLRLVANKKLVNELSDYYERKITATNVFKPDAREVINLQNNIFSLVDLDDYVRAYDTILTSTYDVVYNYQSLLNHKPELTLLSKDPVLLEKYYTQISLLEIQIKRYDFWLAYVKNAAVQLMNDIKKEYDLENE
jgi:hypothetical protein